jgi:hypothetical protein
MTISLTNNVVGVVRSHTSDIREIFRQKIVVASRPRTASRRIFSSLAEP